MVVTAAAAASLSIVLSNGNDINGIIQRRHTRTPHSFVCAYNKYHFHMVLKTGLDTNCLLSLMADDRAANKTRNWHPPILGWLPDLVRNSRRTIASLCVINAESRRIFRCCIINCKHLQAMHIAVSYDNLWSFVSLRANFSKTSTVDYKKNRQ